MLIYLSDLILYFKLNKNMLKTMSCRISNVLTK